jgi:radical SAM superfamily enzyme YgiQ (UPF0313 family)
MTSNINYNKIALVAAYHEGYILDVPEKKCALLGPIAIASVIRSSGYDLTFIDYQTYKPNKGPIDVVNPTNLFNHIVDHLQEDDLPGVIALSCMIDMMPTVILATQLIKKRYPDIIIVLGGPGPSVNPEYIMNEFDSIDVLVYGEGELTFEEWLNNYKIVHGIESSIDVAGIIYRHENRVVANKRRERIGDFQQIPLPDYGLYSDINLIPFETSRGCPYKCIYCDAKSVWGNTVKNKSSQRIAEEIELIMNIHKGKDITFSLSDDNFTVNRRSIHEYCEVARQFKIKWYCFARLDCIDDALLCEMKRSGCIGLNFGVDTGSDRMMQILRKDLTIEQVFEALCTVERHFLAKNVVLSFMWGFPQERIDDYFDTLHLIAYCRSKGYDLHIFYLNLIPGSPLYHQYKTKLTPISGIKEKELLSSIRYSPKIILEDPSLYELIHKYPLLFSNYYYLKSEHLKRKGRLMNNFRKISSFQLEPDMFNG